jgi:putative component of membrane protein insertase Oxa1/YidC/SpoIIIJ protein YidD
VNEADRRQTFAGRVASRVLRAIASDPGSCCTSWQTFTIMLPLLGRASRSTGRPPRRCGSISEFLISIIETYQRNVSANRPAVCNANPTCSVVAAAALAANTLPTAICRIGWQLWQCRAARSTSAGPGATHP